MIGSICCQNELMLMFMTLLEVAKKYTVTLPLVYFGTMRPIKSVCMNIPAASKTKQHVLIASHCKYKVFISVSVKDSTCPQSIRYTCYTSRQLSAERIPPTRHTEIDTVSLPPSSRTSGLNLSALRRNWFSHLHYQLSHQQTTRLSTNPTGTTQNMFRIT